MGRAGKSGKNVKSVKNSLKFKANVKEGILSVRVGVRKYKLPGSARILSNGDYLFLSFPASSELFRVRNKQLSPMKAEDDATDAYQQLNPGRRRRKRVSRSATVPATVMAALKNIPSGYRLGYDVSGQPRLVRKRQRRSKTK